MPGPPCTPVKGRMQALKSSHHTVVQAQQDYCPYYSKNSSAGSAKAATGGGQAALLEAHIRKSVHIKFQCVP